MPTKILAIDDSKTIRLAIKITFAAEDAEVTAVGKGAEAVARAQQMRPDIILIDHDLGAGEPAGTDLCRQLAQDPATANIPKILLTPARQGQVADDLLRECGASAAIGKPFDTQELITLVQAHQGQQAAAQQPAAAVGSAPAPARRPAAAEPVARPAPRPAASPMAASGLRPTPGPVPGVNPGGGAAGRTIAPGGGGAGLRRPSPRPTPGPGHANSAGNAQQARPAPSPAARPVASRPSLGPSGEASAIPVAVPIPFAPASAPSSSMLARLEAAAQSADGAEGLDPQTARLLVQLSREVIERVVWEVVPELAESIIRERQ